jgi:hypothetical protein
MGKNNKAAEVDKAERERLLSQAYNVASQTLREENRDRFNELYASEAASRGVEWTPRLSPEEKAAQQMEQLLLEFPSLRDRFVSESDEAAVEPTGA